MIAALVIALAAAGTDVAEVQLALPEAVQVASVRAPQAVFANVPLAWTGGAIGLALRGLSFSVPAAVGFIALAGASVLNGVVIPSDVRARVGGGADRDGAVVAGSVHNLRAIPTAAVAAFGFFPMALATGAGDEVQRPLATVVIAGMIASTVLTLLVFPGILWMTMRSPRVEGASETWRSE